MVPAREGGGKEVCMCAAAQRSSGKGGVRIEHDLLGKKSIPARAYYGVQSARAMENFDISGVKLRMYPVLIRGLAMVKLAAARANHDCDRKAMPRTVLRGIEAACQDLLDGKLHDQFEIDVFQGGAGTSTNMAANEVIANRALEHMGRRKGEYAYCDPHDHVNLAQSTNDAYPSALHVAMLLGNDALIAEMENLVQSFRRKAVKFAKVLKMGRTQLQDAVPMTLGQEFNAFATSIADEVKALQAAGRVLCEVNMGGTAIGTGLNAPPGYARKCAAHLARITGKPIRLADDLVEATQDTQSYVLYASVLKSLAIKLSKICNDLRLLSSGPRAGCGRSTSPPCSRVPPSCRARSTRSSPRSSTRSASASSATTSPSRSRQRRVSSSSTSWSPSSLRASSSRSSSSSTAHARSG